CPWRFAQGRRRGNSRWSSRRKAFKITEWPAGTASSVLQKPAASLAACAMCSICFKRCLYSSGARRFMHELQFAGSRRQGSLEYALPGGADSILRGWPAERTRQDNYCTWLVRFPGQLEGNCCVVCCVVAQIESGFHLPSTWNALQSIGKT